MEHVEIVHTLKRCELFADIGQKAIEQLAPHMGQMKGMANDILFEEGAESDGLYVVASGKCVAFANDLQGRPQDLRVIQTYESFGELSLLLRGERLMSVRALTDVTLLDITPATFRTLKQQSPDLCLILIMAIVRRLGREFDQSREVMKRIMMRYHSGIDGRD